MSCKSCKKHTNCCSKQTKRDSETNSSAELFQFAFNSCGSSISNFSTHCGYNNCLDEYFDECCKRSKCCCKCDCCCNCC